MMLYRKNRSSSLVNQSLRNGTKISKLTEMRGNKIKQTSTSKQTSKFRIKHLSSLLEQPSEFQKYSQKSERNISLRLTKEFVGQKKKDFHLSRGQSSMRKKACEENFAHNEWVKKNKQTEKLSPIGKRQVKIKKPSVACKSRGIRTQASQKNNSQEIQKLVNYLPIKEKTKQVQPSFILQPLTTRERLHQKRYKDLSARQILYDEQVQPSIHPQINTSIEKAINRLLNRNRAVTEGSFHLPNKDGTRW